MGLQLLQFIYWWVCIVGTGHGILDQNKVRMKTNLYPQLVFPAPPFSRSVTCILCTNLPPVILGQVHQDVHLVFLHKSVGSAHMVVLQDGAVIVQNSHLWPLKKQGKLGSLYSTLCSMDLQGGIDLLSSRPLGKQLLNSKSTPSP